jgi:hypothetical protein
MTCLEEVDPRARNDHSETKFDEQAASRTDDDDIPIKGTSDLIAEAVQVTKVDVSQGESIWPNRTFTHNLLAASGNGSEWLYACNLDNITCIVSVTENNPTQQSQAMASTIPIKLEFTYVF